MSVYQNVSNQNLIAHQISFLVGFAENTYNALKRQIRKEYILAHNKLIQIENNIYNLPFLLILPRNLAVDICLLSTVRSKQKSNLLGLSMTVLTVQ